jgi:hypothetical protein
LYNIALREIINNNLGGIILIYCTKDSTLLSDKKHAINASNENTKKIFIYNPKYLLIGYFLTVNAINNKITGIVDLETFTIVEKNESSKIPHS